MGFTFWSFLVALAWCSIFILALTLFRKHVTLSGKHGAFALILVCILCILRMFLSYDFSFSTGIPIRGVYALFSDFMLTTISVFDFCLIPPWEIFLIIWGLGAVATLFRFFIQYHAYTKSLHPFSICQSKQMQTVSSSVLHDFGMKINCSILCIPELHMPGGIGVFHKKILLPDYNYSDEELYFILAHEYCHFRNGDLLLKYIIHICCCLLWWFPPIRLLQKQIMQATEIRCDMTVSEHLSRPFRIRYMDVLVQSMKRASQKDGHRTDLPYIMTLSETASKSTMVERFKILSKAPKTKTGSRNTILFAIIMCIFFFASYLYLPLPSYEAPTEQLEGNGSTYIDPELSWLYIKDGNYYLVINGSDTVQVDETIGLPIYIGAGIPIKEDFYEK